MTQPPLVWEEPPPRPKQRGWARVARELRSNPGRWALVNEAKSAQTASVQMSRLRNGAAAGFTAGEFETARQDTKIYARYIGPSGAES